MTLVKRKLIVGLLICTMAILGIAMCGCEDLGAYDSTEEYYDCFGDIVFVGGAAGSGKSYSVEDYFYNEQSREDFLTTEDGVYNGVEHSDYVYVAIPLDSGAEMDSLAMYLQAKKDVTVYINVYITDKIPANWQKIEDIGPPVDEPEGSVEDEAGDTSADTSETENESEESKYDDPDSNSRVGEITVHLKEGKWNSFVLDTFNVNNKIEKSIYVDNGQYILLQIRNNSGVRVYDKENNIYVDAQTGIALEKAEITMTNLLLRALEIENNTETNGG